ncbi:MAG: hypothetical protein M3198_00290 [Actinomycetota bacterium]|nr:hypothetical protein [Actinomycetota bacterium]
MPGTNIAQLPAKLYDLLSPLTPEERAKVVQATLILFGDETPTQPPRGAGTPPAGAASGDPVRDAAAFFEGKAPQNKGEALAVAARFRELVEGQETHTKADLKKVVTDARRNFDDRNFARDLNNAKRQAGFFNLGTGRDASQLSYYGQQFVDALPDREAAGKIKRPKVGGRGKKTSKKTTKKSSTTT